MSAPRGEAEPAVADVRVGDLEPFEQRRSCGARGPEVISRGENGPHCRARHGLVAPLDVDGELDEAIYDATAHFGDFIQTLPREGEPSTEKSEVWIFYDADKIYVTCRCWDSAPPGSGWQTRCAATATSCATTTRSASCSIPSTIDATRSRSTRTRWGPSPIRPTQTRAAPIATGTRCGKCGPAASRRLDRRDGHPVQVAALHPASRRRGA